MPAVIGVAVLGEVGLDAALIGAAIGVSEGVVTATVGYGIITSAEIPATLVFAR